MSDNLAISATQITYSDAYDHVNRYIHSERAAIQKMQKAVAEGDQNMIRALEAFSAKQGWNVTVNIDTLAADTQNALLELLDEFNTATAPIRDLTVNGSYTPDYGRKTLDDLATRRGWEPSLDAIVAKATTMIDGARKGYETAITRITAPKGTTQEQLLTEMRVTKAWDRIRQELDLHTSNPPTLMNQYETFLSDNISDPYTTEALLTEGPTYLRINGVAKAQEFINAHLASIDPIVATAAERAQSAGRFEPVLIHAANIIRSIITSNSISTTQLRNEAWVDMTTITY